MGDCPSHECSGLQLSIRKWGEQCVYDEVTERRKKWIKENAIAKLLLSEWQVLKLSPTQ